jgi:hypothetical protein
MPPQWHAWALHPRCACACVRDGRSDGFFPHFAKLEAWRLARPRIAAFRHSLLAHTGLGYTEATPAAQRTIVFSIRRNYRCISNEAEVIHAVKATATLAPVVRFLNFADVSLREQLRVVPLPHGSHSAGTRPHHSLHASH